LLLISIIFIYISSVESRSFCRPLNSTDGLYLDLSPLAGFRGYIPYVDNRTRVHYNFSFSVCDEYLCSVNHNSSNGTKYNNASLCQNGRGDNVAFGKIVDIRLYTWGFIATLSNGDEINGIRRNATFYVSCDQSSYMNVTNIYSDGPFQFYVNMRSRFACPSYKPHNNSIIEICTRMTHNTCFRSGCCLARSNSTNNSIQYRCDSNFGTFIATLQNRTMEIEVETSSCGTTLISTFNIYGEDKSSYSGSSSLYQSGNKFFIAADATYIN